MPGHGDEVSDEKHSTGPATRSLVKSLDVNLKALTADYARLREERVEQRARLESLERGQASTSQECKDTSKSLSAFVDDFKDYRRDREIEEGKLQSRLERLDERFKGAEDAREALSLRIKSLEDDRDARRVDTTQLIWKGALYVGGLIVTALVTWWLSSHGMG